MFSISYLDLDNSHASKQHSNGLILIKLLIERIILRIEHFDFIRLGILASIVFYIYFV